MSNGALLVYIAALGISGIIMVGTAAAGFGQTTWARVVFGLFGAGFLAYAFYLFFIFDTGKVTIFFYAFILPIFAVFNAVKWLKAQRVAAAAQPAGQMQFEAAPAGAAQFGQAAPAGYAQPGQPVGGGVAQPGQPGYPVAPQGGAAPTA